LDVGIATLLGRKVDAEITAMTARYKQHFAAIRAEGAFHEPMFAGIPELLADLSKRDEVVLGIVTGKSRRGLGAVLKLHGLEQTFFTLRTADDCPSKPHPAMVLECCAETGIDPDDTIVVGDAVFDMQMARAAGATGIGVDWGYSSREALLTSGAIAVIAAPAELTRFVGEQSTVGA
jgi:phosphoglycolate phosphatase